MNNLTDEQKKIYSYLLGFLHSNKQAIIIDGSGGVGKSFMVNYIYKNLIEDYRCSCQISGKEPRYRFLVNKDNTNKACESLSQYLKTSVQTIHNYLGFLCPPDNMLFLLHLREESVLSFSLSYPKIFPP